MQLTMLERVNQVARSDKRKILLIINNNYYESTQLFFRLLLINLTFAKFSLCCLQKFYSYTSHMCYLLYRRFLLGKTIDVLLYVDRLDAYRMDTLDDQVIRAVTNSFGKAIWRRTLVVLTHAQLSPPDGLDYNDFFTKRSESLLRYIRAGAGVSKRELGVMYTSLVFYMGIIGISRFFFFFAIYLQLPLSKLFFLHVYYLTCSFRTIIHFLSCVVAVSLLIWNNRTHSNLSFPFSLGLFILLCN